MMFLIKPMDHNNSNTPQNVRAVIKQSESELGWNCIVCQIYGFVRETCISVKELKINNLKLHSLCKICGKFIFFLSSDPLAPDTGNAQIIVMKYFVVMNSCMRNQN